MAMDLSCHTHDVFYDVERARRKCKQLDNEWDECKKLAEEKNTECNYRQILRFIVGNVELHEHHKSGRENIIYIDEDDSDDENDPQYELFLSRLKEHEKSYVLETENNGVPVYIKHEAESGSEDEREQASERKMMSCAEQIVGLSTQKPSLVNSRAALVQYGSDMHTQSGDDSCTRGARILMNLVERENVRGRKIELSIQKPSFWAHHLMQNQHGHDVQVQCSAENCRALKSNREPLVRVHDGILSQKPGARKNWLTDNECDHDDQARLVENDKVQCRRKSGKLVKGNHGADIEALIQVEKEHLYQVPSRRNNWVAENVCKHVDPAQQGEKDKVQNHRISKKVVGATNVVKGDHEVSKRTVVRIDNEHSHSRLGPGNNRLVKDPSEHAVQPQIDDRKKVQNLRKRFKQVEVMSLVKEENEPDKINMIHIDNEHLYQKPRPRNNWVKENPYVHADPTQVGGKDKIDSQIHLWQMVKGKNVVGEDGGANRKAMVRIDDKHLHQKPGRKNNWLTQYQNAHVDQAQLAKRCKEQIDRKFRGKGKVKEEHEANKRALIQIDNEYFCQDPGPRKNWATRNYCQRVDEVQPGKEVVIHAQREVEKVVQGDHELSNKKTAFGNYSVKNETDDSVRTRSDRAGIHKKIRSVEAAQCSVTHIDSDEDNLEKEGNDEIVPEVEILDSAAYIKKGILSPFVPSKRFHKSMMDDEQDFGRPSASDEFRKEVLKVLRKPYDKEEYNMHRKALRVGSYLDYHPDLGKKLKKHRYKRGKCLAILRGFFFWLQNLTREGAFQPWKDRQCLAVEPPSP